MRRGVAAAGAALLVILAGCGTKREAPPGPASADASPQLPDSDAPAPVGEFVGDPFGGIEPLRPQRWTGWPLENVDLELEAGWRIDAVSGKFELEDGLTFEADAGAFVLAIAEGEVVELGGDLDGGIELVVAHGDGIESRYSPLRDALVHAGLPVSRGSAIGLAQGQRLRLVVTVDGVAIDPLLVLRQPLHRWPGLLRSVPRPVADQIPGQSISG